MPATATKPPTRVKPGVQNGGKPHVQTTNAAPPAAIDKTPDQTPQTASTGDPNPLLSDLFSALQGSGPGANIGGSGDLMGGLSDALGTASTAPSAAAMDAPKTMPTTTAVGTMMPNLGSSVFGLSSPDSGIPAPGPGNTPPVQGPPMPPQPIDAPAAPAPAPAPAPAAQSVVDENASKRPVPPTQLPVDDAPTVDRGDLSRSRDGASSLASLIPALAALTGHNIADVGLHTPEILARALQGGEEGALQRHGFDMEDWKNKLAGQEESGKRAQTDFQNKDALYQFDVNKALQEENIKAMANWRMGNLGVNEQKALTQAQKAFDALDPQSQVSLQTSNPDYANYLQRPLVKDPVTGAPIPYGTRRDDNSEAVAKARGEAAAAQKQRADAYTKHVNDLSKNFGWSHDIAEKKLSMQAIKDGNNYEIAKAHIKQGQERINILQGHLNLSRQAHDRVLKLKDPDQILLGLQKVKAAAMKSKLGLASTAPYAVTDDESNANQQAQAQYNTLIATANANIERVRLAKAHAAAAAVDRASKKSGGNGGGNDGGAAATPPGTRRTKGGLVWGPAK